MLPALLVLARPSLPPLRPQGTRMVDPAGRAVDLRGTNLGNWLLLEFWMLGLDVPDQHTFEATISRRFGAAAKERLMERYRANFMRPRDWDLLKTFGVNLVRLPLNYRMFESDDAPKRLRPDAWRWVDRAVDEAERRGMYVVLDLHGGQGGQTPNDHTGRRDQNRFWTVPANQDRAAWLWRQIAARYRKRGAVMGYDVLNEPWGADEAAQRAALRKLYDAVRSVDRDKTVILMGSTSGFAHHGDPAKEGLRNVAFEMHPYPALFGDPTSPPLAHARYLARTAPEWRRRLTVPFLVGEWNPVFTPWAPSIVRRHLDLYREYGWMSTTWSYKVLSPEGGAGVGGGSWGLVKNRGPLPRINPETATWGELEGWANAIGTVELEPWEDVRRAFTDPAFVPDPLPEVPTPRLAPPPDLGLPGWTSSDLGGARTGATVPGDELRLYGAGADVWGRRDEARFVHQRRDGDFDLSVEVLGLEDTNGYAKIGLMARTGPEPDAPTVLISAFPGGNVQAAARRPGEEMQGTDGPKGAFPRRFRLRRTGGVIEASVDGISVLRAEVGPGPMLVGPFVLSHEPGVFAEGRFRDLRLTP